MNYGDPPLFEFCPWTTLLGAECGFFATGYWTAVSMLISSGYLASSLFRPRCFTQVE